MIDFLARMAKYKEDQDECANCGKPVRKGKKFCSYKCQKEGKDEYACVVCGRKTAKYHVYCKKCKGNREQKAVVLDKVRAVRKSPTNW